MKSKLFALLSFLIPFTIIAQHGAGFALDFGGGVGYTEAPNSSSLNPSGAMSVEAWIYPTSFGNTLWVNTIVSTDAWSGTNGEEGYVLRCGDNGKLSFNIATSTTWQEAVSPSLMATNQWHHVVGTFNGSVIKVYLNGVEVGSKTYSGSIKSSNQPLRIGRMAEPTQSREFNGQIDEVRIWGKALSITEIRDRMCRKLTGSENGLLAYYGMDEGTGTSTADLSGNNHNMTLSPTPSPGWKGSGAHIGDTSIALFPGSWSGAKLHLPHPDTDSMTVSNVTGTPAGVQLYLVNGPHPDSTAPGSLFGLMNTRYWGVFLSGGTAPGYRLEYDFNGYPGILSPAALRLVYKTGGAWSASTTAPVSGKLSLTANTSRQFALGTMAPQVNFMLASPPDSSHVDVQGWGQLQLVYSWDKVATKTAESYTWYFDDVSGNFNPPNSKIKAGNNGQDTFISIPYHRMDSLLNWSSLPKGQTRYYKWTVKTASGIEAAEPFYLEYKRGTIGLKEYQMISGMEVFPSVIDGESISYRYTGNDPIQGSVQIIDLNGKVVRTEPFHLNGAESGALQTGPLSSGSYLIKIGNEEKAFIGRFVKK